MFNCYIWAARTYDVNRAEASDLTWDSGTSYYNGLGGVLEAFNVNACNQYPASGNTQFSNLYLTGGTPGWWGEIWRNLACGEAVSINQQGNPSIVTLFYYKNT